MDKRILSLSLLVLALSACGCMRDPGVNAPPDPAVTQSKISQMTPEKRAAYEAAMRSRDQALAATQGKGPLANRPNGR